MHILGRYIDDSVRAFVNSICWDSDLKSCRGDTCHMLLKLYKTGVATYGCRCQKNSAPGRVYICRQCMRLLPVSNENSFDDKVSVEWYIQRGKSKFDTINECRGRENSKILAKANNSFRSSDKLTKQHCRKGWLRRMRIQRR